MNRLTFSKDQKLNIEPSFENLIDYLYKLVDNDYRNELRNRLEQVASAEVLEKEMNLPKGSLEFFYLRSDQEILELNKSSLDTHDDFLSGSVSEDEYISRIRTICEKALLLMQNKYPQAYAITLEYRLNGQGKSENVVFFGPTVLAIALAAGLIYVSGAVVLNYLLLSVTHIAVLTTTTGPEPPSANGGGGGGGGGE